MGYELTRFVGEVDEEFQCSICTIVLQDPVQTPCEHSFCNGCIKDWLSINQTCPADRKPLKISDLKPASRPFRNLWNKLEIKCDFQQQGCPAIIKLENLASHVGSCEYNSVVACDRCNMSITRREYEIDNLTSRVSAQEKEIIKLHQELSDQKEHFQRIARSLQEENKKLGGERRSQEWNRALNFETRGQEGKRSLKVESESQEEENKTLNSEANGQNDEITRIVNDEVSLLEHFKNAMSQQQEPAAELSDKPKISKRSPLKWQFCDNVTIEQLNILKIVDVTRKGFVHSDYPLEPGKSLFKVHALCIENLNTSIGLTHAFGSFYYRGSGGIHVNDAKVHDGGEWERNDIIECGIEYPANFIDDGNHKATVYFSRNRKLIFEKSVTIPKYIFPTVYLYGRRTRLQYVQKI